MTLNIRTYTALIALASAGVFPLSVAAEEMKFMAELTGASQVPPVDSEAIGLADVIVDTEAMSVTWMIAHDGLSGPPVAGHFHGPATPAEIAPPVIDLGGGAYGATLDSEKSENENVVENGTEGSAELTVEQLADLQAGRYYINIHTTQHPDGEIRGQVVEGEADRKTLGAMQGGTAGEKGQDIASGTPPMDGAAGETGADVEAGESLFRSTCRRCHGPKAQGVGSFPKLTGHDFEYLLTRLQQYQVGEKVGPNSALMIPVAKDLSEADMANLAAYISATFP